jgi:hypothetical protein
MKLGENVHRALVNMCTKNKKNSKFFSVAAYTYLLFTYRTKVRTGLKSMEKGSSEASEVSKDAHRIGDLEYANIFPVAPPGGELFKLL